MVNRILNSAVSEVWRIQEEEGLDIEEIDKAVAESKAAPMGPFFLTDLLGLDTVLKVAEHLQDSYGDRFYVHRRCRSSSPRATSARRPGRGSMSTAADIDAPGTLVDRFR